jgi:hypothetical protein
VVSRIRGHARNEDMYLAINDASGDGTAARRLCAPSSRTGERRVGPPQAAWSDLPDEDTDSWKTTRDEIYFTATASRRRVPRLEWEVKSASPSRVRRSAGEHGEPDLPAFRDALRVAFGAMEVPVGISVAPSSITWVDLLPKR